MRASDKPGTCTQAVRRALAAVALGAIGLSTPAHAASSTGEALWVAKYGTGVFGENTATHLAVSPDGARLYVTGESRRPQNPYPDFVTIAYDAATGSMTWRSRYDGPGHSLDTPTDIATSPDGARLYVGGRVGNFNGDSDYGTIAYDGATGHLVWARVFDGPVGSTDDLVALGVSPTKPIVYVTGSSVTDGLGNSDYLTFAYDAATGAVMWRRYYHGPLNRDDIAQDLAVSHDGSTVYVTGASMNPSWQCATVAYDGASGRTRWVRRILSPSPETNGCVGVDVVPDDSRVLLFGGIGASNSDFLTLALSPSDGSVLWKRRYDGPAHGDDVPVDRGMALDGGTVYVTGTSQGQGSGTDYATVAYDIATGAERWAARYDGPASGDDRPAAIVVSPVTAAVYVTGTEKAIGDQYDYDFGTVAYNASGERLWVRHYSSPSGADDDASWVAASPTSPAIFVTGRGNGFYRTIYATVAYAG